MSLSRLEDYRSLLLDEFERRRVASPTRGFSRNAYAKYLGLTASHFNDILKKRSGLSFDRGREITKKLGLSSFEQKFFLHSIQAEHGRSRSERALAAASLAKIRERKQRMLKPEITAMLSQWQHFAIIELARTKGFRFESGWISAKLGISEGLASESMARLLTLEMLVVKEGRYVPHQGLLRTTDDIPSSAIQSLHSQVLQLARKALSEQAVADREFTTLVVAFDSSMIKEAKEKIRAFQAEMSELLTTGAKQRDSLYFLSMQFFSAMPKGREGGGPITASPSGKNQKH